MLTDKLIPNGTVRNRRARIRFNEFFPQLANALGSRQLFGEAFQALRPARLHPCKVCGRMGDHGDSARLQSEFRLVALLSEDDGCEPVEDRISLIVRRNIGENEPLGVSRSRDRHLRKDIRCRWGSA